MKNLVNRAKYVMSGEDGASNMEFIIITAVTLTIAIALFMFGGKIKDFLTGAGSEVDDLTTGVKGSMSSAMGAAK